LSLGPSAAKAVAGKVPAAANDIPDLINSRREEIIMMASIQISERLKKMDAPFRA
jgi:hypothetical protein